MVNTNTHTVYVKIFLGECIRIQYEYIYVKKSPGIRNVFIPMPMVFRIACLRRRPHFFSELHSENADWAFKTSPRAGAIIL